MKEPPFPGRSVSVCANGNATPRPSPATAIIDSQSAAKGAQKRELCSIIQAATRARRSRVPSEIICSSTRWGLLLEHGRSSGRHSRRRRGPRPAAASVSIVYFRAVLRFELALLALSCFSEATDTNPTARPGINLKLGTTRPRVAASTGLQRQPACHDLNPCFIR